MQYTHVSQSGVFQHARQHSSSVSTMNFEPSRMRMPFRFNPFSPLHTGPDGGVVGGSVGSGAITSAGLPSKSLRQVGFPTEGPM